MRFIALLSFLMSLTFLSSAMAEIRENTLIILPFSGGDEKQSYAELREGYPELLKACFSPHSDRLTVLERSDLLSVTGEQGVRFDYEMDKETLVKFSKIMQARFVLKGSYFVVDDVINVQASLYDTETTALIGSAESKETIDNLNKGCMDIAQKISNKISHHFDMPNLAMDKTPEINQYFITGLGHYYGGACHKAIPEFLKILKLDDTHYEARYWLAKCYMDTDLKDSALLEFKTLAKHTENKRYLKVEEYVLILSN